jgi:hypothetical protein
MSSKKLLYALLIVVLLVIIAYATWHYVRQRGTLLVSNAADGSTVVLLCRAGQAADILWARYAPAHGKTADVTERLRAAFNMLRGLHYTVNAAALGQHAGGKLSFRYRCVDSARAGPRAHFRPVPISTCGTPYDDHYAVDMTSRNAAGTVVWDPYSTQSRVSLERYAESPEVAERLNPVLGTGKTSSVRAMTDRYRGAEALQRLSAYELQPGEPGYMEEVGDGAMSLMAQVARRPTSVAAGMPTCLLAGADIDSDFYSDGYYGSDVLREALTSRRGAAPNTLTASKTGLGSIRQDPRFEPGPQTRTPDGDASWSHGGMAGGPTSGGFGAARFFPMAGWDWDYVHGFGDVSRDFGRQYPVEAMETERSTWVM